MVDPNIKGFQSRGDEMTREEIIEELQRPTDKRIFAIAQALERGVMTKDEITAESSIDPWFLSRLDKISHMRNDMKGRDLASISKSEMIGMKKYGFSDIQISNILQGDITDDQVR